MISFVDARLASGITLEDASKQIGSQRDTLEFLENNPGEMKISDAVILTHLYKVEINSIRF